MLMCHYRLTISGARIAVQCADNVQSTRVVPMLRLTTLRLTSDGRLLGFDTGDWSMLLGGFAVAGLLALLV
jgi:hypothetical protein